MATVAYAELDLDDGALRYALRGHPPPCSWIPRATRGCSRRAGPRRWGGDRRPCPTRVMSCAPGTRLVLYTDGLVDRRGRSLERGLALLVEEAAQRRTATPRRAWPTACSRRCWSRRPQDDVCLLVVGFGAGPRFDRELGAQPEELAPLRDDLRAWLTGNAVVGHDRDALVFACSEAVTNAIEHAYRDVAAGLVWVSATMGSDGVLLRVSTTAAGGRPARSRTAGADCCCSTS